MMEETSGRILRYDSGRQWGHYYTRDRVYTRRGQRLHPETHGLPIEVIVTPIGYKIKPNINNFNEPPISNDITIAHDWAKASIGHLQCHNERKFATLWKGGSDLRIGTDGGLKNKILELLEL